MKMVDPRYLSEAAWLESYPRGREIWQDVSLWHGTTSENGERIVAEGIQREYFAGGYFGYGFYVADDARLCWLNYAGEAGTVLRFTLTDARGVLDTRNAADWDAWKRTGLDKLIAIPSAFEKRAQETGVTAVFDRSMGGLCIYQPKILRYEGLEPRPAPLPSPGA